LNSDRIILNIDNLFFSINNNLLEMKKNKIENNQKVEGTWLPFKGILKDRKFHLVLLLIIFLWVILLQMVYNSSEGNFFLFSGDGYVLLQHTKGWFEGHPLSLYPDENATPKSPIPYAMVLSIGHWLGFKSDNSFIFWTYLINLIMLSGSALFLYRFFNRFFPEVAFPSTLLSTLFAPIFYNFFTCTTMPLLFLMISGALAFLGSLPFFLLFAILAGLAKSEGILYYFFLSSLYLAINRKHIWQIATGLIPLFCPFLINRLLIGQKVTQGAVSQILFHYGSLSDVLETGTINFLNHLKSTILGLYKPTEKFGTQSQGTSIYTLPPLFFIFTIIGFLKKNKIMAAVSISFLVMLLIGDSFIVFTGLGYNRHILSVLPIIFAFSFLGIKRINKDFHGFFPSMLIFFGVFFISQEILLFSYINGKIKSVKRRMEVAEWVNKNLPNKTEIFASPSSMEPIIFGAENMRFVLLSPNLNPIFGKYTNSFSKHTEISELLQKYYYNVKYLLIKGNERKNSLLKALLGFANGDPHVFKWIGEYEKYALYSIDLSPLRKKRFEKNVTDEIDIGDPSSEWIHEYKRVNLSKNQFVQFLPKIKDFYDGGRVTEGYEMFSLKLPEKTRSQITCLLGKNFKGGKLTLKGSILLKEVQFDLNDPYFEIFINDRKIYSGELKEDSELIDINIPEEIKSEKIKVKVIGRFISYHYWIRSDINQTKKQE
jgi:hypothetical protein